jgi:hypothetical protein
MNEPQVIEAARESEIRGDAEREAQQRGEDGAEVWAEDEIPFDVALAVVKRRIIEGMNEIRSKGHQYCWLSLAGVIFPGENSKPEFDFHACGDDDARSTSPLLNDALDGVPNVLTEAQRKAHQIAKLRAELAQLESKS